MTAWKNARRAGLVVAAALCGAGLAFAQAPIVYPAKGQSAEQQKKDQSECHTWAVGQTGFDPAKPPPAPAAPPPAGATGTGARVKGAAAGATAAAITGNDTSDAARAGAVAGATVQRSANRKQAAAQQQQAAQTQSAGQQNFNKAMSACLEGRGYTVK